MTVHSKRWFEGNFPLQGEGQVLCGHDLKGKRLAPNKYLFNYNSYHKTLVRVHNDRIRTCMAILRYFSTFSRLLSEKHWDCPQCETLQSKTTTRIWKDYPHPSSDGIPAIRTAKSRWLSNLPTTRSTTRLILISMEFSCIIVTTRRLWIPWQKQECKTTLKTMPLCYKIATPLEKLCSVITDLNTNY